MEEERRRIIMVAVDESEESVHALSWCLRNVVVDVPQNSKDTLILLYVKSPRVPFPVINGTGYLFSNDIMRSVERYVKEVAKRVMEKAERICREHVARSGDPPDSVIVETRVEEGDPRDVICQMVDKLGVDLLVMGSHGYGLIQRAFLGSVSNHCAQNVKCPVLIAKKPKPVATK